MKSAFSKALLTVLAATLSIAAQSAGVQPDWDIRAILKEIAAHTTRLLPVLDQVNVESWIAKGASETYAAQLNSSKVQAKALVADLQSLSRQPEKLSAGLAAYFRMQTLEYMLGSLAEGVRKYQDRNLAELLSAAVAENGANRERFQTYLVDLAAQREQEYQIMDHEAQRCRGFLARQPAPLPRKAQRK